MFPFCFYFSLELWDCHKILIEISSLLYICVCVPYYISCLPCRRIFIYLYLQNHFGSQLTEAQACHFELEQLRPARSRVHDLAQRIHAYFAHGNIREIAHLDHCSDEGRLPFESIASEIFCCALGAAISVEDLVGSQQAVKVLQVFVVLVVKTLRTNYVQILAEVWICSWLRTLVLELGSQACI